MKFHFCQGENSPAIHRWEQSFYQPSPVGTTEWSDAGFNRPYGTWSLPHFPGDESPGYYQTVPAGTKKTS